MKVELRRYLAGPAAISGKFPNILGEWPNVYATQKSTVGGCAFFRYNDSNSGETLSERESSAHLGFDASRVSSLYQNSLYDVRVNALFGLSLIRAYQA